MNLTKRHVIKIELTNASSSFLLLFIMAPLTFEQQQIGIVVTGKTFDVKEKLKALNGKWNPTLRAWVVPTLTEADRADLLAACPQRPFTAIKPVEKPYWVCCDKAIIVNAGRQTTDCPIHQFRVRGAHFTGD